MHLAKKPHFQCPVGVGISLPHPVWDCFTPGCGTEHSSWRSAPRVQTGPPAPLSIRGKGQVEDVTWHPDLGISQLQTGQKRCKHKRAEPTCPQQTSREPDKQGEESPEEAALSRQLSGEVSLLECCHPVGQTPWSGKKLETWPWGSWPQPQGGSPAPGCPGGSCWEPEPPAPCPSPSFVMG